MNIERKHDKHDAHEGIGIMCIMPVCVTVALDPAVPFDRHRGVHFPVRTLISWASFRRMHFTTERLERLQRSLELALNQEWPKLSTTQKRLAKVRPTPIDLPVDASPLTVVATVATDGGENRLSLEPIQVQVIRVADSLGVIYF